MVGPSGAGKSTVGQLLSRFWDVNNGGIYGGIDIRKIPTEQLMQMVSFVFQDSFMFQQTMYENVRMGMDKTREEVEQAAKAAQIHDLISCPMDMKRFSGNPVCTSAVGSSSVFNWRELS